jgi:hypothetical protein
VKRWILPLILVNASAAWADDIGSSGPITFRFAPDDQDRRKERPGPPPENRGPDVLFWYEISFNASFEWMAGGNVSGTVPYFEAFEPGVAVDGQLAAVYAWVPKWGWWVHDAMVRPHVGYSYRTFEGRTFTDDLGTTLTMSDWTIQTVYGGITFGTGHLPGDSDVGFMTYITIQMGGSYLSNVHTTDGFGVDDVFIDASWEFYIGGGIGVELMVARASFRLEFGLRDFGRPNDAGGTFVPAGDDVVVWYIVVGLTFAF